MSNFLGRILRGCKGESSYVLSTNHSSKLGYLALVGLVAMYTIWEWLVKTYTAWLWNEAVMYLQRKERG